MLGKVWIGERKGGGGEGRIAQNYFISQEKIIDCLNNCSKNWILS
jgi:hypothetical protein